MAGSWARRSDTSAPDQTVLVGADLLESRHVPPALEWGLEPNPQPAHRGVRVRETAAEREHVGVVVLAREACGLVAVDQRGADADHLVGDNALADTAPAQHDRTVGATVRDALRGRDAEVRVVHGRLGGVGAEVLDLVPPADQLLLEALLERKAAVVAPDRDPHAALTQRDREAVGCEAARGEAAGWEAAGCGTGVSQRCRSGVSPRTMPKNACWIALVIGPGSPVPIGMRSTEVMGLTSTAVPQKNISSIM